MIIIFLLVFMCLSLLLMGLNFILSNMYSAFREKASTFECGFDPKSSSRLPFSLHFFLVALIFLIFDVEITLLIPFPYMWSLMNKKILNSLIFFAIFILILGTLIEWLEKSLEWHN